MLDQGTGLVAIQAWHHDVEEDQVGFVVSDHAECLEAVSGNDYVKAFLLQQCLRRSADGLAVVDHHDLDTAGTLCSGC